MTDVTWRDMENDPPTLDDKGKRLFKFLVILDPDECLRDYSLTGFKDERKKSFLFENIPLYAESFDTRWKHSSYRLVSLCSQTKISTFVRMKHIKYWMPAPEVPNEM